MLELTENVRAVQRKTREAGIAAGRIARIVVVPDLVLDAVRDDVNALVRHAGPIVKVRSVGWVLRRNNAVDGLAAVVSAVDERQVAPGRVSAVDEQGLAVEARLVNDTAQVFRRCTSSLILQVIAGVQTRAVRFEGVTLELHHVEAKGRAVALAVRVVSRARAVGAFVRYGRER